MQERPLNVRIEKISSPMDGNFEGFNEKTAEGIAVRVLLNEKVVWQRRERTAFTFLYPVIGAFIPKPFYESRIKRALKRAEKVASSLKG